MKAEDIQFLIELQEELNTLDKLCQADPRFWVIRDYKWVLIPNEYAETYRVYDNEGEDWSLDGFLDYLRDEDSYDDVFEKLEIPDDAVANFDLIDSIVEQINVDSRVHDFEIFGVVDEPFIVQDTMFLTNREAKEHIKSNYYHYTSRVHTYAMTAWRSPQVERLINILQKADFNQLLS